MMRQIIIRVIAITGLLVCLAGLGSSQVTLSKGWGPGKRAYYDDNCKLVTKSVFTMCRTMISELRQLMACQTRGTTAYGQPGEQPLSYQILFPGER